jgi:hypothetical protein
VPVQPTAAVDRVKTGTAVARSWIPSTAQAQLTLQAQYTETFHGSGTKANNQPPCQPAAYDAGIVTGEPAQGLLAVASAPSGALRGTRLLERSAAWGSTNERARQKRQRMRPAACTEADLSWTESRGRSCLERSAADVSTEGSAAPSNAKP